jgi:hypothetical protein
MVRPPVIALLRVLRVAIANILGLRLKRVLAYWSARLHLLETLMLLVSLALLATFVYRVRAVQEVHDPPHADSMPEIGFFSSSFSDAPLEESGVKVAVWVEVKSCADPVDVRAVLYFDDDLLRRHPHLLRPGDVIGVAVFPAIDEPIALFQGSRAGLAQLSEGVYDPLNAQFLRRGLDTVRSQVSIGNASYHFSSLRATVGDPFSLSALSVPLARPAIRERSRTPIPLWGVAARFNADWLRPRSHKTCYLTVPAVMGERVWEAQLGAQFAVDPSLRTGISVSSGNVRIVAGPGLSLSEARPPPDVFRSARWRCARPKAEEDSTVQDCEAVVPFIEPNASNQTLGSVLLGGVLIGVLSAVAVELLLRLLPSAGRRRRD